MTHLKILAHWNPLLNIELVRLFFASTELSKFKVLYCHCHTNNETDARTHTHTQKHRLSLTNPQRNKHTKQCPWPDWQWEAHTKRCSTTISATLKSFHAHRGEQSRAEQSRAAQSWNGLFRWNISLHLFHRNTWTQGKGDSGRRKKKVK